MSDASPSSPAAPRAMSNISPSSPAATRAMPDNSPSNPAATTPTTGGDRHCHLLDLPVETLQRITNQLHRTEALPALRLACKALDHITFDRFAKTFETARCCIFSEKRWLSLKKLLEKPSRISSRIRKVEFTACLFEDVGFSRVPLALNRDDGLLTDVLNKTYKTYSESEAAAIQAPINVALFGRILLALKSVSPRIGISFRMPYNQGEGFEHLRVQCDVVLTMVITHHKIRNLSLSHISILTLDNVMTHLRPELLQSVSKLAGFSFVPPRGGSARVTRRNTTAQELRVSVMYKVLQSARNLWNLELNLDRFALLSCADSIAATALDATVSNNIQRFVLRCAKLDDKHLLKALSRWAPKLVELELREICLLSVREGWSPILQLISTMPKLKHLILLEMGEKSLGTSNLVVITMDHLTQGA